VGGVLDLLRKLGVEVGHDVKRRRRDGIGGSKNLIPVTKERERREEGEQENHPYPDLVSQDFAKETVLLG
jgi:hypothetical protein